MSLRVSQCQIVIIVCLPRLNARRASRLVMICKHMMLSIYDPQTPSFTTDRITFTTLVIEMPRSNTAEYQCTSLLSLSPRAMTGKLAPASGAPHRRSHTRDAFQACRTSRLDQMNVWGSTWMTGEARHYYRTPDWRNGLSERLLQLLASEVAE